MKKQIGLIAITTLICAFVAFSGVASAQASNVQVLLFTQPGCSACATMDPIVTSLAAQYGVTLVRYNPYGTALDQGVAQTNNVGETPTIIISVNGAATARFTGVVPAAQIEAALKAAVGTTTVVKATPTPYVAPKVVKATPTPYVAPKVVKATPTPYVAPKVVKATPTPYVAPKVVTAAKQPSIQVVTATQTPTTSTQTVPEFSLLGLGAPALLVGALYLFLRRR